MRTHSHRPSSVWIAALVVALVSVGLGVWLGEARQTLLNATNICLACMGLG